MNLCFITKTQSQIYQLPNSGFEQWDGSTTDAEPTNWNGFPSAQCDLTGLAALGCNSATATRHAKSTDTRPGTSGNFSLRLFATQITILGSTIIANGTITSGQIRIGSTNAESHENYNITRTNQAKFRQEFHGIPDSLVFWAKFICPSSTQEAKMIATIHGNYNYREPETSDPESFNHIVGRTEHYFSRGQQNWQRYSIPMNYSYPAETPEYILITFATNRIPGQGSESDVLFIDDIEMIYNTKLSNIIVNGLTISNFNPDIYEYEIEFDCYESAFVNATAQSENATVNIIQINDNSNTAIIQVSSGDEYKEYTVHFSFRNIAIYETEICQGQDYNGNGFNLPIFTQSGFYQYENIINSSAFCDSIIKLNITVHPSYTSDTINIMICENSSYNFYGRELSEAGIYDTVFTSMQGCDSIIILKLETGEHYRTMINASICEGEIYDDFGFYQNYAGNDSIIYIAQNDCDSLVILNLTVLPVNLTEIKDTINEGSFYSKHGFELPIFSDSGNYEFIQEHSNIFYCDSIVILKLTVIPIPELPQPIVSDNFDLHIFPIPAIEEINILISNSNFSEFNISIWCGSGKLIMSLNTTDNHYIIDASDISSGIYLLKAQTPDGKYQIEKFIID